MALICVTSNQMALICVTSNQKVNLSEINTWKWLVRILMSSLSLFGEEGYSMASMVSYKFFSLGGGMLMRATDACACRCTL